MEWIFTKLMIISSYLVKPTSSVFYRLMAGRNQELKRVTGMILFLYQLSPPSLSLQGLLEGTRNTRNWSPRLDAYSYRQVLGEIIYACIVCRVDIGYAATFLFALAPTEEHYKTLKDVIKYLRCQTKD
jgi:hypothetical protein